MQNRDDGHNGAEERGYMQAEAELEGCLALRLRVPNAAEGRVIARAGGILCIGVREQLRMPPLVGICDETDAFGGASATNAMETILTFLREAWYLKLPVAEANIVELDSMGRWDLVRPDWTASATAGVTFLPLKWLDVPPCSKQALLGAFGEQGKRLMAALHAMRASGALSLP